MFPSLLTHGQVAKEIYNRHLKLVQEFLIRYMDLDSKTPYHVHLPIKEYCTEAEKINVTTNVEEFFPDLQKICALAGWKLSLSGDDWKSSEFICCSETDGVRDDMLSEILNDIDNGNNDVAVVVKEARQGSDGYRIGHGKRSADNTIVWSVPKSKTQKHNESSHE